MCLPGLLQVPCQNGENGENKAKIRHKPLYLIEEIFLAIKVKRREEGIQGAGILQSELHFANILQNAALNFCKMRIDKGFNRNTSMKGKARQASGTKKI